MNAGLWEKAHARLKEIYGSNPPINMLGRFETEKMLIRGSNLIAHFGYLAELAEYARSINSHISMRCEIGNSFVAWLLGAVDVNPMEPHYLCGHCKTVEFRFDVQNGWDLRPKKCACGHMMYPDGHRLFCDRALKNLADNPYFDVNMPPELQTEAGRMLHEYFGKEYQVARIRIEDEGGLAQDRYVLLASDETPPPDQMRWEEYARHYMDKPHYTFIGSAVEQCIQKLCQRTNRRPECVDFLSEEVIAAYKKGEFHDLLDSHAERRAILAVIRPECFSAILKIDGLLRSSGVWEENQLPLWETESLSVNDLIAYREDVFDRISEAVDRYRYTGSGLALNIMDQVRKGGYRRRGMQSETEAVLKNLGIPDWYINSMKKVVYLFPRAHCISYLRSQLILMWFFLHERELFEKCMASLPQDL